MSCVVPGCDSQKGASSHKFPKNRILGRRWVAEVKNPLLDALPYEEIFKREYRVCYKHFAENSWIGTTLKPRLKDNAFPTLMLPESRLGEMVEEMMDAKRADSDEIMFKNILPSEISPGVKYFRSPGVSEIRRSSLRSPFSIYSSEKTALTNSPECVVISSNTLAYEQPSAQIEILTLPESIPSTSNSSVIAQNILPTTYIENSEKILKASNPINRKNRKRLESISKIKKLDLTPKGEKVYMEAVRLKKELWRRNKQLKSMKIKKKECEKQWITFSKRFEALSATQRAVVEMQLRNAFKTSHGHRFTDEEKTIGLALYKHSPSTYKYMTGILTLPSVTTVKRHLSNIELDTGINSNIFSLLKDCASNIEDDLEKVQLLMWDETFLRSHLSYDVKKDKIIGFEDFGNRRTSQIADHTLVFMTRGLHKNSKLPLSYYFCNSQTKSDQLSSCIKENLKMMKDSGFDVVATVCDQGASNVKALKLLREQYERNCFQEGIEPHPNKGVMKVGNSNIIHFYDTCHLDKGDRNNLLNKDLEISYIEAERNSLIPRKFVEWRFYEKAFEMDLHSDNMYRNIPKVSERHVKPTLIKKMKVSYSRQVLSRSMAKWLETTTKFNGPIVTSQGSFQMDKGGIHAARYADFADKRFDSCNSRKQKYDPIVKDKPLLQVVTDTSPHLKFWSDAIRQMLQMRYVSKESKKALPNPPSLNNWINNLRLFPELWERLKEKGFSNLKTGYINQDPIENFFGSLKSHGLRYVSPTCTQTEGLYKALMVSNLSSKHSIGANCLDDEGQALATLKTFTMSTDTITENSVSKCNAFDEPCHPLQTAQEKWSSIRMATRIKSAGQFAKLMLSKIEELKNCQSCKDVFFSKTDNVLNLRIISDTSFGCEQVAGANYYERGFTRAINLVYKTLPRIAWKSELSILLVNMLNSKMDFEWVHCNDHRSVIARNFNKCIVLHCITRWCLHMNRILSGEKNVSNGNVLEKQARKNYLMTRRKKVAIDKQKNPQPEVPENEK